MKNELIVQKCMKCGATVIVKDPCNCNCGLECCGEKMVTLEPNTTEASFEKHIPNYEIMYKRIKITVNHPMDEDHYIERIYLVTSKGSLCYYLKPGDEARASFPYETGSTIYSLCNKHGLWSKEVE